MTPRSFLTGSQNHAIRGHTPQFDRCQVGYDHRRFSDQGFRGVVLGNTCHNRPCFLSQLNFQLKQPVSPLYLFALLTKATRRSIRKFIYGDLAFLLPFLCSLFTCFFSAVSLLFRSGILFTFHHDAGKYRTRFHPKIHRHSAPNPQCCPNCAVPAGWQSRTGQTHARKHRHKGEHQMVRMRTASL